MKLRNKKTAIISLVLLVAFAAASFGFAAWTQQININGTVSANGSFKLEVTDTSITAQSSDNTAVASHTDTAANFDLGTLAFPGDVVAFSVTIKNVGTIPADLVSINGTLGTLSIPGWSYVNTDSVGAHFSKDGATYLRLVIKPFTVITDSEFDHGIGGDGKIYETLAVNDTCTTVSSVYIDPSYNGTISVVGATAAIDFDYVAHVVAGTLAASHS
jgi:hypothetical protein